MFVNVVVDTSQVMLFVTVLPQHGVKLIGWTGTLPEPVEVVLGLMLENGTFQDVTVDVVLGRKLTNGTLQDVVVDVGGGGTTGTTELDGSGMMIVGTPARESVGPLSHRPCLTYHLAHSHHRRLQSSTPRTPRRPGVSLCSPSSRESRNSLERGQSGKIRTRRRRGGGAYSHYHQQRATARAASAPNLGDA